MIIEEYNKNHNLQEIIYIDRESVEDFLDEIKDVYSQDDLYDIKSNYLDKDGLMVVGLIDSKIVAMCAYLPISNTSAGLYRLRVKKELRGNGYGKQILTYIEDQIKNKKFKQIEFSTAASRENTLHFYKKRGYSEISREMYGNIETVIFKKTL